MHEAEVTAHGKPQPDLRVDQNAYHAAKQNVPSHLHAGVHSMLNVYLTSYIVCYFMKKSFA